MANKVAVTMNSVSTPRGERKKGTHGLGYNTRRLKKTEGSKKGK